MARGQIALDIGALGVVGPAPDQRMQTFAKDIVIGQHQGRSHLGQGLAVGANQGHVDTVEEVPLIRPTAQTGTPAAGPRSIL